MEMIKPEDCLKHDVCKFVGDAGCLEGCDFRLEEALRSTSTNNDMPKLPELEEVIDHVGRFNRNHFRLCEKLLLNLMKRIIIGWLISIIIAVSISLIFNLSPGWCVANGMFWGALCTGVALNV